MNPKNIEYLCDQIKYTGFGESLEKELSENIRKQTPEFTLKHRTGFGSDTVDAELHFRKSAQTDRYFFNSYRVNLQRENSPEPMSQTFYINKVGSSTLKEAYNLLCGRAVNKDLADKEGRMYNAWLQMDFAQTDAAGNYKIRQYHQNYGFDLEKELFKHPIKELAGDMERTRLVQSLRKGNCPSVVFMQDGGEHKRFIEANPRFKTVNVYDGELKRMDTRQSNRESRSQDESAARRTERKASQTTDDGAPDIPPAARKRTRKQSPSVS